MNSSNVVQREEAIANLWKQYWLYPHASDLKTSLPAAVSDASGLARKLGETFAANVKSTVATLSLPYRLAFASVSSRRLQALFMAERIRRLKPSEPDEPRRSDDLTLGEIREIHTLAGKEFQSELADERIRLAFDQQVMSEMETQLSGPEVGAAVRELSRQGVILVWSALEVFLRDYFANCLNENPNLTVTLTTTESTKKFFDSGRLHLEALAGRGFKVGDEMGNIFSELFALDSLERLKPVYAVLFPGNESVKKVFDHKMLWLLWCRRNLIVHRRGLVDKQYLRLSGDNLPEGDVIQVAPLDLKAQLEASCELVAAIIGDSRYLHR